MLDWAIRCSCAAGVLQMSRAVVLSSGPRANGQLGCLQRALIRLFFQRGGARATLGSAHSRLVYLQSHPRPQAPPVLLK